MRLRTWLAALTVVTSLLGTTGVSRAQYAPPSTGGVESYTSNSFETPTGSHGGEEGGLHALHSSSVPLGPAGVVGAGAEGAATPIMPPGTGPWPQVSPFHEALTEFRVKDGTWYRDQAGHGRDYYFRAAATLLQVRKPNRGPVLVGNEGLSTPVDGFNGFGFAFPVVNTSVFQDTPRTSLIQDPSIIGEDADVDAIGTVHDFLKSTVGGRFVFGWDEAVGTGVEFNGFFTPQNDGSYNRGLGGGLSPTVSTTSVTNSILADDGAGGVLLSYDQLFALSFESVYAGGGITFLTNDIFHKRHSSVRLTRGFRYLYIYETFGFEGVDSGASVNFNANGTADDIFPFVLPFRSTLNSTTRSNLFGPDIGVAYTLGGDAVKLVGFTKFGVMVNMTEYAVNGQGFGDGFDPDYNPNLLFSDEERHTHLSPLFEQQLGFDLNVVGLLPVFKHTHWLEKATIHIGYSVILVWEVARPQYNIDYRAQPLTPQLASTLSGRRTQWYTHGWDFSLVWRW